MRERERDNTLILIIYSRKKSYHVISQHFSFNIAIETKIKKVGHAPAKVILMLAVRNRPPYEY